MSFLPNGYFLVFVFDSISLVYCRNPTAYVGTHGERLELCVGGRGEILAATAHESAYSHPATTHSNSLVDTSQLLSQEAGEANPLRLRDTDRKHHVKVCVLASRLLSVVTVTKQFTFSLSHTHHTEEMPTTLWGLH